MLQDTHELFKAAAAAAATGKYILNCLWKIDRSFPDRTIVDNRLARSISSTLSTLQLLHTTLPLLDTLSTQRFREDTNALFDLFTSLLDDVRNIWDPRKEGGRPLDFAEPRQYLDLADRAAAFESGTALLYWTMQLALEQKKEAVCSAESSEQSSNVGEFRLLAENMILSVCNDIRSLRYLTSPEEEVKVPNGEIFEISATEGPISQSTIMLALANWLRKALLVTSEGQSSKTLHDATDEASPNQKSTDEEGNSSNQTCTRTTSTHGRDYILKEARLFEGVDVPEGVDPKVLCSKVNRKYLDSRTLDYYDIPWTTMKDEPEYLVIWRPLDETEFDVLFSHTRRLRISEEMASIDPSQVLNNLLLGWTTLNEEDIKSTIREPLVGKSDSFDAILQSKKQADEKERDERRKKLSKHGVHPPPIAPPCSETRYYEAPRTLGEPILLHSLVRRGFRTPWLRGNDAGQTWFYGETAVHHHYFSPDYVPQLGHVSSDDDGAAPQYLLVGPEWVEEATLKTNAYAYQKLPSGHFSLDPRLTNIDVNNLLWASSEARDQALRRKYRNASGGDLHSKARIKVPAASYMTGEDELEPAVLPNTQDVVGILPSGISDPMLEDAGSRGEHPDLERRPTSDSFVEV